MLQYIGALDHRCKNLQALECLKGHGNEADFLGFLQKLHTDRSFTLPFEPFWLRIRGDIRNRKTTPDSLSRGVD
jgi:hypothetical protein